LCSPILHTAGRLSIYKDNYAATLINLVGTKDRAEHYTTVRFSCNTKPKEAA